MVKCLPLDGLRVIEIASSVACAYAGQLLHAMGAEVVMIEPPDHSPLRKVPPFLGDTGLGALFASVSSGKKSVVLNLRDSAGRDGLEQLLCTAQILLVDAPIDQRGLLGLDPARVAQAHPSLVYVSVLPFGATGPKADWQGSEITLFHAGGEGYLMPNGLTADMFPDRGPLKTHGYFAERQGGVAAAMAGLCALWSGLGQMVDVSVQEANLAVGAFAIQRFGDGSIEHRSTRSFRYGGVIECADGFVELLTLEERQWQGLVALLGSPDWLTDPALADPVERSARGAVLNENIRAWARSQPVEDLVAKAQKLGVPMARYNRPEDVIVGKHEQARAIFQPLSLPGLPDLPLQTAPFRFDDAVAPVRGRPPQPGEHQTLADAKFIRQHEGSLA